MNNMDWDDFRYFIATAETGSLTSAAKQLGSNQPTVGRHIDALESALGTKLFQRTVKGLILTEEGEFVFEQTKSMRSSVLKIQRKTQGEKVEFSGTVRVALPEGLCLEVLSPLLPKFYNQYPNINLILNVSSSAANLTKGEADIAIRLFRPKDSNLVVKSLGEMQLGLYASSDYIKRYGFPADKSELKNHRVISYADQLSTLPENQWLIEYSESSLFILRSDNTTTRLRATIEGIGISIQPHIFCRMHTELVPLLEQVELPSHNVWMVYHNDLRHLGRIRAVVEFLTVALQFKQERPK